MLHAKQIDQTDVILTNVKKPHRSSHGGSVNEEEEGVNSNTLDSVESFTVASEPSEDNDQCNSEWGSDGGKDDSERTTEGDFF